MNWRNQLLDLLGKLLSDNAIDAVKQILFLGVTVVACIAGFYGFMAMLPEGVIPQEVLATNHIRIWVAIGLFFIIPRLFDILSGRDFKQDRGRLANDPVALAIYFSFRMLSVAVLLGWLFA